MKPVGAILAAALAISLAGCILKGKPAPVAATPVVPKPVAPPATPPAPPAPLSVTQLHPDLPAPQPLSTEALESAEGPGELPPPAPAPPRGGSKKGNAPGNRPRDTAPATPTAPMPAPAAAAPAEPDARPTIQEIVPTEELNRLKASADGLQGEIRKRLAQLPKKLSTQQKSDVNRINSFLALSEEAERGGDMRKANELAERGMALVQGLSGGR